MPPSLTPTLSSSHLNDSVRRRVFAWIGLGLAVWLVLALTHPSGSHPLQSLALHGVLWMGTAALVLTLGAATSGPRLGVAIWAGLGLAVWALLRWWALPHRAAGRETVLTFQWMAVAIVLGWGVATSARRWGGDAARPWRVMRRCLTLAAIGFGAWAVYQYGVAYPRAEALLRAELAGRPADDLMTQSLLHALRERRVGGGLGNPNLFAAQLAVLSIFCLGTLRRRERWFWQSMGALGWCAALTGVVLTRSRGGMLTFLAGTSCALGALALVRAAARGVPTLQVPAAGSPRRRPTHRRMNRRDLLWAFGGVALAVALGVLVWRALGPRLGRIETVHERLAYWGIALRVWARGPILGDGPGQFIRLYLSLKPPLARESQFAHCWLLEYGAALGLLGVALAGAMWWDVARRTHRALPGRRPDAPWHTTRAETLWLGLAALTLAFDGLFEFSLQWRELAVTAGLAIGGVCGLTPAHTEIEEAPPPPSSSPPSRLPFHRRVVGVLLVAGPFIAAAWMTPSCHLADHLRHRGDTHMDAGHWTAAARAYGRALEWIDDDPALEISLAGALGRLGRDDAAHEHLRRAVELNPLSASARAARAQWRMAHGRWELALDSINQAVARYPSHVGHRMTRAEMLLRTGHPRRARADLLWIEETGLLVWAYERPRLDALRRAVGLGTEKDATAATAD